MKTSCNTNLFPNLNKHLIFKNPLERVFDKLNLNSQDAERPEATDHDRIRNETDQASNSVLRSIDSLEDKPVDSLAKTNEERRFIETFDGNMELFYKVFDEEYNKLEPDINRELAQANPMDIPLDDNIAAKRGEIFTRYIKESFNNVPPIAKKFFEFKLQLPGNFLSLTKNRGAGEVLEDPKINKLKTLLKSHPATYQQFIDGLDNWVIQVKVHPKRQNIILIGIFDESLEGEAEIPGDFIPIDKEGYMLVQDGQTGKYSRHPGYGEAGEV